jgi:hypothetical protein
MCNRTDEVGEQVKFAFRNKAKKKACDEAVTLRFLFKVFFVFIVMLLIFTLISAFMYQQFYTSKVQTEQDVMDAFHMRVRSVFYYHDILVYHEGVTKSENIDWKIVIYDSDLDGNVQGTVLGNSTIFIRSGQMPEQIRRTCNHEILHALGCNERCAYYLQWQIDIPPCSYLYMNASETYAQSQIKYYRLFG